MSKDLIFDLHVPTGLCGSWKGMRKKMNWDSQRNRCAYAPMWHNTDLLVHLCYFCCCMHWTTIGYSSSYWPTSLRQLLVAIAVTMPEDEWIVLGFSNAGDCIGRHDMVWILWNKDERGDRLRSQDVVLEIYRDVISTCLTAVSLLDAACAVLCEVLCVKWSVQSHCCYCIRYIQQMRMMNYVELDGSRLWWHWRVKGLATLLCLTELVRLL